MKCPAPAYFLRKAIIQAPLYISAVFWSPHILHIDTFIFVESRTHSWPKFILKITCVVVATLSTMTFQLTFTMSYTGYTILPIFRMGISNILGKLCNCRSAVYLNSMIAQLTLMNFKNVYGQNIWLRYNGVIMGAKASQITSVSIVCCRSRRRSKKTSKLGVTDLCHRWIPRTKGQLRRKCFHLMTSSW